MSPNRKRYVILSERKDTPRRSWWAEIVKSQLLGVALGAILTYYLGFKAQLKTIDHQKRQEAFGLLMGEKVYTAQLCIYRFEAWVYSDYHEARWKIAGAPLDLQESMRWMRKSEDLGMELAKNNKTLCETVGSIRVLFKNTPKLVELTDRVYNLKPPQPNYSGSKADPFKLTTMEQLIEWKDGGISALVKFAEDNYEKPIEELVTYLREDIKHYD